MATVDEILTRQAYAAGDDIWTEDSRYPSYRLCVEPEYVPVTNKRIADFNDQVSVCGERNAQYIGYRLPRYDDGIDLRTQNLYIHYQTAFGGGDSVPCNVSWSDNYVRICWMVPAQATQEPDRVQMMIYATGTNSAGDRVIWKTLPASYTIHDGLEIGGGIPEPDTSWYEQFVAQMEGKVSTAQGYADDAQASRTEAAGSATVAAQSATASAQALEDNKAYVESQKETFVGYNKRDTDLKYANALVGSASGTTQVTVDDAWSAPVINLDISGRSEQAVTTGKQLLNTNSYSIGSYSNSTGLPSSSSNIYRFDQEIDVTPGSTLYLLKALSLYYYTIDDTFISVDNMIYLTKKIPENAQKVKARIMVSDFATFNSNDYMISYDPITSWEPYTGGKPSPSPEYPQPIKGTGTVSTGAQMLDTEKIQYPASVPTIISDNGRTIQVSGGVATGRAMYDIGLEKVIGRTLYVSGTIASKSVSDAKTVIVLCVQKADDSWEYKYIRDIGIKAIIYAQIPNDAKQVRLDFNINDSNAPLTTVNTAVFKDVMISVDTPKPWEPYTGGKPSPSPEYPQPLDVTVTGVNLFDSSQLKSMAGGTWSLSDGGRKISVTGINPWAACTAVVPIECVRGKTVTLSGNVEGRTNVDCPVAIQGRLTLSDGKLEYYTATYKKIAITIPEDAQGFKIELITNNRNTALGIANTTVFADVLLSFDAEATWEPFTGYQTAAITLTEPLHGIGDVRDRIMCKDGIWGIERNVLLDTLTSDIVISSSGGVTTSNNVIDNRYTVITCEAWKNIIKKGLYENGKKTIGFCTIAPPGMINDWNTSKNGKENVYTINAAGAMYISIPISALDITADITREEVTAAVKQYVTDHDVFVGFVLDTPTWEPLPSATQSALNALTTYTGTTHVTIMAGGPEPDVGLEYVMDTRAVIADLQAQIDAIRNGGTK